jgi:hypothetical protein
MTATGTAFPRLRFLLPAASPPPESDSGAELSPDDSDCAQPW